MEDIAGQVLEKLEGITRLISSIIFILFCVSKTHMKLISSTVNLFIILHLPM